MDAEPTWSPDGQSIAFTRGTFAGEPNREIWVMDADGSGQRRLASGALGRAAEFWSSRLTWSPDGTRIVFASIDGGISVMSADGRALRRLTRNPADHDPAWQPVNSD